MAFDFMIILRAYKKWQVTWMCKCAKNNTNEQQIPGKIQAKQYKLFHFHSEHDQNDFSCHTYRACIWSNQHVSNSVLVHVRHVHDSKPSARRKRSHYIASTATSWNVATESQNHTNTDNRNARQRGRGNIRNQSINIRNRGSHKWATVCISNITTTANRNFIIWGTIQYMIPKSYSLAHVSVGLMLRPIH